MTHKILYIFSALAVLFGFTACTNDDSTDGGQHTELSGNDVIVKAGIGANSVFTRSNPIGSAQEQAQFNSNDMIYIYDEEGNHGVYKYDGQAWNFYNPQDKFNLWNNDTQKRLIWDTDKKSFYAAYPQADVNWKNNGQPVNYKNKNEYSIIITTEQATKEGLANADVMFADTTITRPDNHTLALNFKRQTARIILKLSFNNNQFEGLHPSIGNVLVTGRTELKYNNPDGNEYSWNKIAAYNDKDNNQWICLCLPQKEDASKPFLNVMVNHDDIYGNGNTFSVLQLTGMPALEAGKSYTFNVTVGKEKMSIENVTVNGWGNGGVVPGGEAQQIYK